MRPPENANRHADETSHDQYAESDQKREPTSGYAASGIRHCPRRLGSVRATYRWPLAAGRLLGSAFGPARTLSIGAISV